MRECRLIGVLNIIVLCVIVVNCSKKREMSDTMTSSYNEEDSASYRRMISFYKSFYVRSGIRPEKVLEQPGDINYQFPANAYLKARNPKLIGSTALHSAQTFKNKDIFDKIIEKGADFTIKNSQSLTVLHQSIQFRYDDFKDDWQGGWFQSKIEDEFANAVLDAHIQWNNTNNPYDNKGISHFHIALMVDHSRAVEFFLQNGISVDQIITKDSPILAGYTPLHIAGQCSCVETARVLLKNGADLTIQNSKGLTPLRSIVHRNMEIIDWMHTRDTTIFCFAQLKSDVSAKEKIIKLILSESTDETNVIDELGFSYFHAACTLEDTSVVEQFLEKGVDLKHRVKMDSPVWPGYTALHFAAHFNVKMVKLLINSGAAIDAKDLYGLTPFDICVERFSIEDLHAIVSSNEIWKNIKLSDGTTTLLDLMYVMQDVEQMSAFIELEELDINTCVPPDSPLWPGYSVLHLATIFTETIKMIDDYPSINNDDDDYDDDDPDFDTWSIGSDHNKRLAKRRRTTSCSYIRRLEILLDRGADITAKDPEGSTPLHLAFRLQKFDAVNLMLNIHPDTVNPIDKDNLSHLYIACFLKDLNLVETLIFNETDVNISLLPTFQFHKNEIGFINRYRSLGFKNGGSTPLHAAVRGGSEEITKLLLQHGADVNAKDENGLTPLHQIFSCDYNHNIAEILLSSPNLKDSVFNDGLSHLHIASSFGNANAVERLLDAGANIDATISVTLNSTYKDYNKWSYQPLAFMHEYSGCTPLHIAMGLHNGDIHLPMRNSIVAKLLLSRGANTFIRNSAGRSVAYISLPMRHLRMREDYEIQHLIIDDSSQRRLAENSGITMLHIACWKVDVDMVKDLLSKEAEVNAQAHADSPVWPKWTPMHVLMLMGANNKIDSDKIDAILRVMLDNGADLTIVNAELDTPLHLTEPGKLAVELVSHVAYRSYANSPYTGLLLEKLKDYSINPTNIAGISHFHIASLRNDVENMKKFLELGVEVNKPIDFFSDRYPGCTALHLALNPETSIDTSLRVPAVELLLKHGADVNAQDIDGNTSLHFLVKSGFPCNILLGLLLSAGADLNAINMLGETAYEVLLRSGNFTIGDLKYLHQHGCRINSCNTFSEESYIGIIAKHSLVKDIIDTWEEILEIDNAGRTAIHTIVSVKNSQFKNYTELIGILMRRGCDIDRRDNQGRTALHIAIKFININAVSALLTLGADVNLVDSDGKTALAKSFEIYGRFISFCGSNLYSLIIKRFAMYIYKMQICGLSVHELNEKTLADIPRYGKADEDDIKKIDEEINKAKSATIGSSQLTVYDFLTKSQTWTDRTAMSDTERNEVDEFLRSINTSQFADDYPELVGILRLRYRKYENAQM